MFNCKAYNVQLQTAKAKAVFSAFQKRAVTDGDTDDVKALILADLIGSSGEVTVKRRSDDSPR